jgi:hypothetical protein
MPRKSKTSRRRTAEKGLLKTLKEHPVRTAAVAAGAVAGVALLRKAVNTAAKVATIHAVAGAAKDVAGEVRKTKSAMASAPRKPRARTRSRSRAKRRA